MCYFGVIVFLSFSLFVIARPLEPFEELTLPEKPVDEIQNKETLPKNDNLSKIQSDSTEGKIAKEQTTVQKVAEAVNERLPPAVEFINENKNDLLKREEITIDNAIYLVEQASKLQSEGRNVTFGIIEEKNINGEKVKVFNDGSEEIVVRDNSYNFKVSIVCLTIVGIILFLLYSYCLY